jgi:hypothetical protein
VEQVGLAEANAAEEEEGVEGLAGVLGDGEGRAVGEFVGVADDEGGEGVVRVEQRFGLPGGGGLGFGGRSRVFGVFLGLGLGEGLGGGRDGQAFADDKLDLDGADRDLADHGTEQVEVVIGQPHHAEVVGHLQGQDIALERRGAHGGKPEGIDLRFEHAAQGFLRSGPDGLGGGGH